MDNGWYWDIEANGLYLQSTKVWYIRFKSLDGSRTMKVYPFRESVEETKQKIQEWIDSFEDGCLAVGHNILGYDAWAMWKFFGIQPKVGKKGKDWLGDKYVQFVDTFVLTQYLAPDLPAHSLAYLSSGSENEKMDYRAALVAAGAMVGNEPKGYEFSFYHPIMDQYCDDDVDAGIGVFKKWWNKAKERYGEANWIHPSFRQNQKDYFLYSAQAYTGVKFHKERALALIKVVDKEMAEIKAFVDPKLPPRPLKASEEAYYKMPAKPFKKNGELSATFEKWLEKHSATYDKETNTVRAYGKECSLVAGAILPVELPMEIEDNADLKQWFLDNGWVPHEDFYNFKRDPVTNKPMRDERGKLIKTTPKIQNAGQLCPNLLKLESEIPAKVVRFLSLRNRKGVVEGWLNNWRLEFDGRLSAEISGYTPTFRVRHRTVDITSRF